jgi:hypothetical protein
VEGRKKKIKFKKGIAQQAEASTRGRLATSSSLPAASQCLSLSGCTLFLKFFYLKKKNFGSWGNGLGLFGRMGVQHLHFLKLAPTLGSANSSKIHGEWRFYFFPKKNLINLEHSWTFISTVGIFVL